jgi:hemerythrin-like domain-containing protein
MINASPDRAEGLRLYDELLAVHTILRRGSALLVESLGALKAGRPVHLGALVAVARWHTAFLHHHHHSEDEQFWPLLRELFPASVEDLSRLTAEHEELDAELKILGEAIDAIGALTGNAAARQVAARNVAERTAHSSAVVCHNALVAHLDDEEPVLRTLFPQVAPDRIRRLRAAIVAAAPKSGPDLVLGLLADPEPAPGYEHMIQNFPAPVRWLRPVLLARYRSRRRALGVG